MSFRPLTNQHHHYIVYTLSDWEKKTLATDCVCRLIHICQKVCHDGSIIEIWTNLNFKYIHRRLNKAIKLVISIMYVHFFLIRHSVYYAGAIYLPISKRCHYQLDRPLFTCLINLYFSLFAALISTKVELLPILVY